jgi:hypothetical protein
MVVVLMIGLVAGCAHKIDWQARVGHYTYDDAIQEFGPPDRAATTSDGTLVADWVVSGPTYYESYPGGPGRWGWRRPWPGPVVVDVGPTRILRLNFGPDKRLASFRKVSR